jgi:hypothetical protein
MRQMTFPLIVLGRNRFAHRLWQRVSYFIWSTGTWELEGLVWKLSPREEGVSGAWMGGCSGGLDKDAYSQRHNASGCVRLCKGDRPGTCRA